MHNGRFKLKKETLAMGDENGTRVAVEIPAGDTVDLIADPSPGNKTVEVLWEGRMVTMCTVGLNLWGIDTRTES